MSKALPARESEVVKTILRHLAKIERCHAHKVHGSVYGNGGEPDIDACIDGRTVKIEVKAEGKKSQVTPIQKTNHERWRRAGALVIVADCWADVEEALIEAGMIERDAADR